MFIHSFICLFLQPLGVLLGVVPDLMPVQASPLISPPGGGGLMLQSCRYPGRLMLQSCRYPGPSGWEWERNSGVLPLVALIIVNPVCSRFSVSAVICQCFDLSVRLSRVHRWVVPHGMFRLSMVSRWTGRSIWFATPEEVAGCTVRPQI